MIRLDVLQELLRADADARPSTAGNSRWAQYAAKYGHDIEVCICVGCTRYRGEPVKPGKRTKRSRVRGYVWLTDADDLRVRKAAHSANQTMAEFVRQAILLRLKELEG